MDGTKLCTCGKAHGYTMGLQQLRRDGKGRARPDRLPEGKCESGFVLCVEGASICDGCSDGPDQGQSGNRMYSASDDRGTT